MCNYVHECFFIFLIILACSRSDPIVIHTLKKGDQYEEGNNYGVTTNQGVANIETDSSFNKINEKKLNKAITNVRYGEQNNNKNDHFDANNFNTGTYSQKGGLDQSDFEDKKAHKKGHHSNGFHNSYHKDEVGSNSSFYDDGSDEGGNHIRKSDRGSYGNAMEDNKQGNHIDSVYHANQGVNQGQYDNSNMYDANSMNNRNYNRNQHFDDRRQADQRGSRYGTGGNYGEKRYANTPYNDYGDYNHGGYNSYDQYRGYPKKRITIFEDPRYDGQDDNPRYHDDYIELDVRPPMRRHDAAFDRRRHHDYY